VTYDRTEGAAVPWESESQALQFQAQGPPWNETRMILGGTPALLLGMKWKSNGPTTRFGPVQELREARRVTDARSHRLWPLDPIGAL